MHHILLLIKFRDVIDRIVWFMFVYILCILQTVSFRVYVIDVPQTPFLLGSVIYCKTASQSQLPVSTFINKT